MNSKTTPSRRYISVMKTSICCHLTFRTRWSGSDGVVIDISHTGW